MSNFDRQSQAKDAKAVQPGPAPRPASGKRGMPPALIAVAGGLVAAAGVTGVLLRSGGDEAGTPERPTLGLVKKSEVDKASETLAPDEKAKIVEEAKACKAPLAYLRLTKTAADGGGVVRIRAGNYLSPAFNVADAPINVAVPFPAPYEAGKGEIAVEGAAKNVFFELTPGLNVDTTGGARTIPVWWKTDKPCGS